MCCTRYIIPVLYLYYSCISIIINSILPDCNYSVHTAYCFIYTVLIHTLHPLVIKRIRLIKGVIYWIWYQVDWYLDLLIFARKNTPKKHQWKRFKAQTKRKFNQSQRNVLSLYTHLQMLVHTHIYRCLYTHTHLQMPVCSDVVCQESARFPL